MAAAVVALTVSCSPKIPVDVLEAAQRNTIESARFEITLEDMPASGEVDFAHALLAYAFEDHTDADSREVVVAEEAVFIRQDRSEWLTAPLGTQGHQRLRTLFACSIHNYSCSGSGQPRVTIR